MEESEYTQEQAEDDLRKVGLTSMLTFYAQRIEELAALGEQLVMSEMTHRLGLFLNASADAHRQTLEWAERVLTQERPDVNTDESGWLAWVTCYRLTRRQVAAWSWHPDYWSRWWSEELAGEEELTPAERQERAVDEA